MRNRIKLLLAIEVAAFMVIVSAAVLVSEGEYLYEPIHELLGASLGVLITTFGLYKIDQLT